MATAKLHRTVGVRVGRVQVGGGALVVQSMTMTDTADAAATAQQCIELAEAGSELVRVTVNLPEAAAAVPEIKQRMLDAGCTAPLIGDFHYNGHLLLTRFPPARRARQVPHQPRQRWHRPPTRRAVLHDLQGRDRSRKPVRIGVNGGSLNQELVVAKMEENTTRNLGRSSEDILNECMVISAIESTALALETGLRKDQIIISCKVSRPRDLIAIYRDLARKTDQPLHLGLTEAGMGMKGLVWSASAIGILLNEGIGDTIRVSLTPRPGGDRREGLRRVRAAAVAGDPRLRAERHRLRVRADDEQHVPGTGRAHAGVHPRTDADVEAQLRGRRKPHPRGHGLRRQRAR